MNKDEVVSGLSHRVVELLNENREMKKLLKEIVGDHNAAYAVGILNHEIYSVRKAEKYLKKLEVK